jgi:hypothetical protein
MAHKMKRTAQNIKPPARCFAHLADIPIIATSRSLYKTSSHGKGEIMKQVHDYVANLLFIKSKNFTLQPEKNLSTYLIRK